VRKINDMFRGGLLSTRYLSKMMTVDFSKKKMTVDVGNCSFSIGPIMYSVVVHLS